jgi:hypothetical protein
MIVLTENADQLPPSASARDIAASTNAAKLVGCQVFHIPPDFSECGDAEGALWMVPKFAERRLGIWIGYIPPLERYAQIYDAALVKGIQLVNAPAQHRVAEEFDSAYPLLGGLTPESVIIYNEAECEAAAEQLGLPIFIKGAVQSRKSRGWKACVAETVDEVRRLTKALLELENRSRGRVVLRKVVALRHTRRSGEGFPLGREYRVFIYRGEVLGMGYYWEGDDPMKALAAEEESQVRTLALEAAARLQVPYVAIDIGQLGDGNWIVIEAGDAQFSGVSQIPLLQLWHRIAGIPKLACTD